MTRTELAALRTKTCGDLQLAIAALAPWSIIDALASACGMLEALEDVPLHALVVSTIARAHAASKVWDDWRAAHAHNVVA
jgi:hypothetical protein